MLGRRHPGTKVSLVPRLPEHIPTIYRWHDYPEVFPRSQLGTYRKYFETYQRNAAAENCLLWSVVANDSARNLSNQDDDRSEGDLIGFTGLYQCRRGRECRDSYIFIIPEARGRGYGSEAVFLCASYAFTRYSADLLQAPVDIDNIAIHRVLERVGYQQVGRVLWWTREQDIYLLRREWWEATRKHAVMLGGESADARAQKER